MTIDLSLNEIEILLLSIEPRNSQDMGAYFRSAKGKLNKARKEAFEQFHAKPFAEPAPVDQPSLI